MNIKKRENQILLRLVVNKRTMPPTNLPLNSMYLTWHQKHPFCKLKGRDKLTPYTLHSIAPTIDAKGIYRSYLKNTRDDIYNPFLWLATYEATERILLILVWVSFYPQQGYVGLSNILLYSHIMETMLISFIQYLKRY